MQQLEKIILIGASDHCKYTMDIVEQEGKYQIHGIIDKKLEKGTNFEGYTILGYMDELVELIEKKIIIDKIEITNAVFSSDVDYINYDIKTTINSKLKSNNTNVNNELFSESIVLPKLTVNVPRFETLESKFKTDFKNFVDFIYVDSAVKSYLNVQNDYNINSIVALTPENTLGEDFVITLPVPFNYVVDEDTRNSLYQKCYCNEFIFLDNLNKNAYYNNSNEPVEIKNRLTNDQKLTYTNDSLRAKITTEPEYKTNTYNLVAQIYTDSILYEEEALVVFDLYFGESALIDASVIKELNIKANLEVTYYDENTGIDKSKDKIIETAFNIGGSKGIIVGGAALLGAAITAFYMSRVMLMTFAGNKRWAGDAHPHESPILMWAPMAVLAVGSVTSGFLLNKGSAMVNWLAPVVDKHHHEHSEVIPAATVSLMAIAAVVIGVAIAVMKYRGELAPVAPANVSIWTRFVRRDLLQDDANEFLFMRPGQALTSALVAVDEKVIDGAVRGVGSSVLGSATGLRKVQTGYVRNYALLILVGALIILGSIWVVTH